MVLKPIRKTPLCTAGIATHSWERNPHPSWQKYPYQLQPEDILYRQQAKNVKIHSVAAYNKTCQTMTQSCARMCQVFARYFSREPHPYLSSICVSTAAGTWPARSMMSRGTDGFCCHLEWWLPAVWLNQGWQTDRQTNWMTDLYIAVSWWWPFA